MITQLKVERFKSIRQLSIECRRVNLFIGEPNTGKSNILEALGMLSWVGRLPGGDLQNFVRFQLTQNLFFDNLTDEPLRIECLGKPAGALVVKLEGEHFQFWMDSIQVAVLDHRGHVRLMYRWTVGMPIKFYRYRALEKYESAEPGALIPPHGPNLFTVVYGSKLLRESLAELFRPFGLQIVLEPAERAIKVVKHQHGVFIALPFAMSSDTLQRMLFYSAAMESNKEAVLVFEEPEAHAFPYYTKHLGERIAADASNQYFIATHNPYLLVAVLEKAKKQEVAVFATEYRNYETKVTALTEEQISRLLDADPFLGLQGVLEAD
jgi:hypothetical protein